MLRYKYYDTPEGQDVCKKVFVTSKYAALAGLAAGTLDVLMYSHPKGVVNTVARYGWYLGPMVGMATAFTVTANVAQNARGKNDELNYVLGGVAAASVFSTWAKSGTIFVPAAFLFGVAALVKKTTVDNGWKFFPDTQMATKTAKSVRHDWTINKDIEELKTWTTGKN